MDNIFNRVFHVMIRVMVAHSNTAVIGLALIATSTSSFADDYSNNGTITDVTVYPGRALVSRTIQQTLPAGDHVIIVEGLPASVRPDSLRVKGTSTGDLVIGSTESKVVLPGEHSDAIENTTTPIYPWQPLADELQQLRDQETALKNTITAIDFQLEYIGNLSKESTKTVEGYLQSSLKNPSQNYQPQHWKEAWQTLGEGKAAMLQQRHETNIQLRQLKQSINEKDAELRQFNDTHLRTTTVRIHVRSNTNRRGQSDNSLTLQYQVNGASWAPVYDARLNTQSQTITLEQYALVQQSTGEDWSNVQLTLSTAKPSAGTELAKMRSRYLSQPYGNRTSGSAALGAEMNYSNDMPAPVVAMVPTPPPVPLERARHSKALTVSSEYTVEHRLPTLSTIPSDTSRHKQRIDATEFNATLSARAAPSQSNKVWLYGSADYNGSYPLLSGNVSIFTDDTLVGKSKMDLLRPKETLQMGFGEDQKMKLEHNLLETTTRETGTFSTHYELTKRWQTQIINYHTQPMQVTLLSQLPLSKNDDVRVSQIGNEPDQTAFDNEQGVLAWQKTVTSGNALNVNHGYVISYPERVYINEH